jgi:3-dehydroquinate synthase
MNELFRYGSVPITVSDGFDVLIQWIDKSAYSSYIILTDSNCKKHALPLIKKLHTSLKSAEVLVMKAGEKNKNLKTAEKLLSSLFKLNPDRKALLINLGGGIVCDMGAFVASVYKRGIPFIHIPTSYLAMVDAAIGSKNGIDFNGIKNSVGTWSHPAHVFIHPIFLQTLPFDELMNGFAESFKHALCDSYSHYELVIQEVERLHLTHLILHSVAFKTAIVNKDLYDNGNRKILNLGHTTGHAIEALLMSRGYPVMHGMCVFYGIVTALLLSVEEQEFPKELAFSIIEKINRYCPLLPLKKSDVKKLIKIMRYDKKNAKDKFRMVLLKNIGEPMWDVEVHEKKIDKALRQTIDLMSA